jgi:hypothetical protein
VGGSTLEDAGEIGPRFHGLGPADPMTVDAGEVAARLHGLDVSLLGVLELAGLELVLPELGFLPLVSPGICTDVGRPFFQAVRFGAGLLVDFSLIHPAEPGGAGRETGCAMAWS